MKKGIFALFLSFLFVLSSCSLQSIILSDSQIINGEFDKVLEASQNRDAYFLKSLFSEEAISKSEAFDSNVELLFEYFQGVNASYEDNGALTVEESNEDGIRKKVIRKTYDVTTSMETYRFAISFVVDGVDDVNNLGIWSMYIIKMKDDSDPTYAYWGDGKDSPGINIGIRNVIA